MRRASYRDGIFWIAANDDTEWTEGAPETAQGTPSVTACLLADLFEVTTDRVRTDVIRKLKQLEKAKS